VRKFQALFFGIVYEPKTLPSLINDTGLLAIRRRKSDGLPFLGDSGGKAGSRESLRYRSLHFADK